MTTEENKASVVGHITELRKRLIRSVIAIAVAAILCFAFYNQIFDILLTPVPQGMKLQAIEMTEMLGTIMRVCLFGGIIVSVPYLTYELIMFVSPALTRTDTAAGVTFAYFIVVPRMLEFLFSFGSDIATVVPRVKDYINIMTRMLLAIGLVFELPVLTTFLARIGIISPKWLSDRRKTAIILAFILAAMITPTIDPINQCLVAAPLVVLYEMSIWLAKLVYKKKPVTDTPESTSVSE